LKFRFHCRVVLAFAVAALCLAGLTARGELVEWLQNLEGSGRFEAVFFRSVSLLGRPVSVRRLPGEARSALNDLVAKAPGDAELYRMRALADQAQLDFSSEEADWQRYAQLAPDKVDAQLQLADFYHRRLRPLDEIKALAVAAQAPPSPADRLRPSNQQRSWQSFERIFDVIRLQALPEALALEQYNAWLARYPRERAVYSRFFDFLTARNGGVEEAGRYGAESRPHSSTSPLATPRLFAEAERLIRRYEKAFPRERVFPIEARATLAYKRGSTDEALALYDRSFQPLWQPALIGNYFDLLKETHRLREFLGRARAAASADPSDVAAAARLFHYYQQQGNSGEALRALVDYRARMEQTNAVWKGDQLWTLARLLESVQAHNEAARAYYALYSLPGVEPALQENALAGIANLLLTAPEQPIAFGSNSISFLRDIGTLDSYPGVFNGILSLLLNSQSPAREYSQAEGSAVAYFHRARAAELVALFDERFPRSSARSGLHATLLDAYAVYGMDDAILRAGRQFLTTFPRAPQRVRVSMLMADSYARKDRVKEELALYDELLHELAARADHVPLGEGTGAGSARAEQPESGEQPEGEEAAPGEATGAVSVSPVPGGGGLFPAERRPGRRPRRIFSPRGVRAEQAQAQPSGNARSPQYSQVLERYISRLVALDRPLEVLELFRREMDYNPNDPGLYERLATFLEQNQMDDRIEDVYEKAIRQFPDRSWSQKLARWYLRRREQQQFERLSRRVIETFSGTELEEYFRSVVSSGPVVPQMYVQLNLYARQRFPHNLTFVRNLLEAYRLSATYNRQAWDALIRQYWYYDDNMRAVFFAYLASGGQLESELETVRATVACKGSSPCAPTARAAEPDARQWNELAQANPAAAQFVAEAEIWRSHFEAAVPVSQAIADAYPDDSEVGERASSLFRSLAPFNPQYTQAAVTIEETLAKASPGERDLPTRIGDIYADREMFAKARPYWNRVPSLEPGNPDAFLESATVFWDYFLFADALRVINEARQKFSNPALFAYQAGAVYEGRREYGRAVGEYLKGTLGSSADAASRERLLRLFKRAGLRSTIDKASAQAASGGNPDWNAVSLRIDVLGALNQRAELENLLTRLAQGTSSLELLGQLQPVAERYGFDNLRTLLLQRQIALLADPVEKLQLRLQLARFYESKNQVEQARALMESVYSENPLLLGVVRSTVDFYWRNKMWDAAIETLLKAAKSAYPELGRQLNFEAAGKAAEAKEYARAREVLSTLLQDQPYNAEYLAAMADTYARQGDDKSLRDFYLAKIQACRDADLPADQKTERIAALRRGLIPALARLKDFAGGVDQYIEIINKYPEDEGLAQEAAAFADRNGRRKQLLDYYTKAAGDSPKDFRWPMVLARVETYFEDYSAAIASYARARTIRPDRTDLLAAQAGLEERLMQFGDAEKSYSRLYELTYQNPEWMEKVAELEARQGHSDAAVAALTKALVEGRPERPELYFNVAERLAGWNMLTPARQFAERGMALAGVAAVREAQPGALSYVSILTRLRDYSTAYARLREASSAIRAQKIEPNLTPFLSAMGSAAQEYFTPEEKNAFSEFLLKQKEGMEASEFNQTLIPLAQYAGLTDLEARWRHMVMMAGPDSPEAQPMAVRLGQLQEQRMRFNEYGEQLEAYWRVFPARPGRDNILPMAAASYRSAGNRAAELRVLEQVFNGQRTYGEPLQRYLELLSTSSPDQLVTISGGPHADQVRDAAASTALETGNVQLALQAIAARGRDLPPVWARAYTGLAGLYYSDASANVNSAFQQALDTRTIGARLAQPPNRDDILAGNVWFYYGGRYGEYLAATHLGNPEDYLPATLEGTPANSDAYSALGDYYRDAGQLDAALDDFERVLELNSHRGDARDRRAQILWQQGKREEAVKEWRLALEAFQAQEDGRQAPPSFWTDLGATLQRIGEAARNSGSDAGSLFPPLHEAADHVVRSYIRRNGSYRAAPILEGAFAAEGDAAKGVDWLVDLSRAAQSPIEFLSELVAARWIPSGQKEPLYQKILALAQEQADKTFGTDHSAAVENLHRWQLQWIDYLLDNQRLADAQIAFNSLAEDSRDPRQPEIATIMVRIAAQSNKIDELLQQFEQTPEKAPSLDVLRNAALGLEEAAPSARPAHLEARRLLEYVYTRQIEEHDFAPANFLGLAEIRLQQGKLSQAMALLDRMNRAAGEPFENLASAGDLLVQMGHPAEAARIYGLRVKAVPWDTESSLKLAQAEAAANAQRTDAVRLFARFTASPEVDYARRATAAEALGILRANVPRPGSAELEWLIRGGPIGGAESVGFFYARLKAARDSTDPATKIRLLLDAIAVRPEEFTQAMAASPPGATSEGVSPRIPLAQAAATSNRNELAVSAITPLLDPSITAGSLPQWRPGGEGRRSLRPVRASASEETEQPEFPEDLGKLFLAGQNLSDSQKAPIAADLAVAFAKLDRLAESACLWKVASMLATDQALQSRAAEELAGVLAHLKLEQADRERRPVISNHLEQNGVVRPRLFRRGEPSIGGGAAQ